MSDIPSTSGPDLLRGLRGLFLLLGALLIILGLFAAIAPLVAGLAAVVLLGSLLLISGVVHGVAVFQARTWSGSFIHLLMGVLALVVGFFCINHPEQALLGVTELLAIFFVVGGLFRIFGTFLLQNRNWLLNVLSGFISLLLGLLVWKHLPFSAEWLVGLYVGIDLLFQGITAVGLAMSIPKKP